jgi:hypothetical protein
MSIIWSGGLPHVVSGVTSFNTRTGAVTLLGSDVITALGYTPANGALYVPYTGATGDLDLGSHALLALRSAFVANGSGLDAIVGVNDINGTGVTVVAGGSYGVNPPAMVVKNYASTPIVSFFSDTVLFDAIIAAASVPAYAAGVQTPLVYNSTTQRFETHTPAPTGVTSFNTRTGAVTLSSGDVTTALTYTPENLANKAINFATVNNTLYPSVQAVVNYISTLPPTGVTSFNTRTGAVTLSSGDVTTALTYTPENIANKATDFVTVNNTLYPSIQAVVNYISALPPTGVTSFNTRTGAVTLSSGDVTTALGYTPEHILTFNNGLTRTGNIIALGGLLLANSNVDLNGLVLVFAGTLPGSLFGGQVVIGGITSVVNVSNNNVSIGITSPSNSSISFTASGIVLNDSNNNKGLIGFNDYSANIQPLAYAQQSFVTAAIAAGAVTSFNTRTGAVTLSSGDVTTALTYTPENIANKATDFTTVNNTLYPSIQAVVNYIASLPPSGVSSFNTRTGAITLTSGDVTTALGYTPANSTTVGNIIASNVLPPGQTAAISNIVTPTVAGLKMYRMSAFLNLQIATAGICRLELIFTDDNGFAQTIIAINHAGVGTNIFLSSVYTFIATGTITVRVNAVSGTQTYSAGATLELMN